jgi:hypothetical protein
LVQRLSLDPAFGAAPFPPDLQECGVELTIAGEVHDPRAGNAGYRRQAQNVSDESIGFFPELRKRSNTVSSRPRQFTSPRAVIQPTEYLGNAFTNSCRRRRRTPGESHPLWRKEIVYCAMEWSSLQSRAKLDLITICHWASGKLLRSWISP